MKIGQKEYQGQHVKSENGMTETKVLLEKNVKIYETDKPKEGEQSHNSFIGERKEFYERVPDKFDKYGTGTVIASPILSSIIGRHLCEIVVRVRRIK